MRIFRLVKTLFFEYNREKVIKMMKILFCSGEAYPFSKSGGLADVAAALPKALKKLGHEVTIITPFYQQIKPHLHEMTHLGDRMITMGTYEKKASYYKLIYDEVPYIFVDNDDFYNRKRYYGYEDDAMRFTFFNFAIFEYMILTDHYVDIVHANDWQTGLTPFFLDVNIPRSGCICGDFPQIKMCSGYKKIFHALDSFRATDFNDRLKRPARRRGNCNNCVLNFGGHE